ncbi:MAG: SDR family NAD(P)-dependent oxidoreductase [Pseudomonadota bacterium]
MSEFENKVVIITGAGGGIGREHALAFASRGARVVVNDLGGNVRGDDPGGVGAAQAVVDEITALGGRAVASTHSVADADGAQAIVQSALDAFGTVDVVVNNAGILRNRTLKNTTPEDIRAVIEVHLLGSAFVTHAAWPVFYEKGYGRVVLTTSVSGIFGQFGQSAYGAAKMGMLGMMNVLALEGRSHGILVNCLSPGADTRMTALDPGIDADNPRPQMHPKLITPVALYLASEAAPTGVVMHALGGRYLRSETVANQGVQLGQNATYEDLLENIDAVMDMHGATPLAEPGNLSALFGED